MAEVSQSHDEPKGKIRSKKQSTKIDMTPMVDLAFLLLTFFILTTTFSDRFVLKMTMPEQGEPSPVNDENVMFLAISEENKLFWWVGLDSKPQETNFSKGGLRKLLLHHKASNPNLMILIKPDDSSGYQHLIDVIDEMVITQMTRYTIVDLTDEDRLKLAAM